MIRGLYAAATGVDGMTTMQDFSAENLAHVNVPGYRRQGVAYETFEAVLRSTPDIQEPQADLVNTRPTPFTPGPGTGAFQPTESGNATDSLLGTRVSFTYTSFVAGPLERTGNPLDVATTGDAFFVVDGPTGPLLTRNGSFQIGQGGQLQTTSGLNLRGEGGAVNIPPNTADISISEDGTVFADGVNVGRLLLVSVPLPTGLTRAGTTLFQGPIPATGPAPGTVQVLQGYREQSNVQPVREMVNMLTALRTVEANDRALRALSEAIALATRPA
jgi:flagellar basal body rod protein FlgG